jgi:hypothetical protein
MRLSSSSCACAKTARASRLPASRSSPMPYSTPRTDRVFGSAAADQHLAPVGAGEEGVRISTRVQGRRPKASEEQTRGKGPTT